MKFNTAVVRVFIFFLIVFTNHLFAQTTTLSFPYTGTVQTFTVPPCVYSIHVKAWGAGGGAGGTDSYVGAEGGGGGYVESDLAVVPGQVLTMIVGSGGSAGGPCASSAPGGVGGWGNGISDGGRGGIAGSLGCSGGGGAGGGAAGVYNGAAALLVAGAGGGGSGGGNASSGVPGGAGGQSGISIAGSCTGGTAGASVNGLGTQGGDRGAADGAGGGGGGGGYNGGTGGGAPSGCDCGGCGGGGGNSFSSGTAIIITNGTGITPGNSLDPDLPAGAAIGASGAGPGGDAFLLITYSGGPPPVAAFGNTSECLGNATQFNDSSTVASGTITSWSWDFGDGTPLNTSTNPSHTYGSAGVFNVTLIVTGTAMCYDTIVKPVTVFNIPVSNAGPDTSFCTGTPVNIGTASTAGYTYLWTPSTGLNSTTVSNPGDTTTNNTFTPITTIYTVTTTAGICSTTDQVTVTVNPAPVVAVPTITPVCDGSTVTVPNFTSPTPGATFTWTNSSPSIGLAANGTGDIASFTATNAGSTTVNATITVVPSANGCSGPPGIFTITVYPTPSVVVPVVTPVCNGSNVNVAGFSGPVAGTTYSWTNSNPAIGLAANGTGNISPFIGTNTTAATISGTITVTPTANGCSGAPATFTITVYPTPVSNAGPDITICSGSSASIGAASSASLNYLWSPSTGLSATNISNPTVTLVNAGPAPVSNTYIVATGDPATFCFSSDTVIVTTNPLASVNAGSDQSVCAGTSVTLAGSIGGAASSATWSGGTGSFSPNASTLNAVYAPSAADIAAGSIILSLATNDPAGPCPSSNSSMHIFFYNNPVVNFSVDDPDGCPVHCVKFTDLSTIGGGDNITSWNWAFGDGLPDSTGAYSTVTHCYNNNLNDPLTVENYDVTLTVTSNHGCSSTLTKPAFINIFPLPDAAFDPTPNPTTVFNTTITLTNQSSSNVSLWEWSFGEGDTLTPGVASPVHTYPNEAPNNYLVTLLVTNVYGCTDSITHEIIIAPEFAFYIPNAFTPNGDGINDYFYGTGTGIDKYDIMIFDRWGNAVFHGTHLSDYWDGKANKG
ncbi:MAG: PKD domain-containing protein, partial [Bacteroidia bacterium]